MSAGRADTHPRPLPLRVGHHQGKGKAAGDVHPEPAGQVVQGNAAPVVHHNALEICNGAVTGWEEIEKELRPWA